MGPLQSPVATHMTSPVFSVRGDDELAEAERLMAELDVSALPVVQGVHARANRLSGVISRTDLLRAGRVRVSGERREHVLSLPKARVREFMTSTVEVVRPDVRLADAARRMVRQHLHRLFVSENDHLAGVVTTREMMRAVREARVRAPMSELMTKSVVCVKASDPLSLAVDRLAAAHVTGLVVVEDAWPVGLFGQAEALAARDAPPDYTVEEWMDPRFLSLPAETPIHRVAAQALATGARRVLAVGDEGVRGIVSGMDFTDLVRRSAEG